MTETRITMTGADGAHYREAAALTSRLVPFPDGVSRHFTLTNAQWRIFDAWQHEYDFSAPEAILQGVCEVAEVFGPPERYEEEVRLSLGALLRTMTRTCLGDAGGEAPNDNSAIA